MHRTARNLLIAICCTGLLASFGCSNTGEMSVNGFYQSRVGGLAGDECDEILMQAAEADEDVREEMKDEYRECVEDSIADQGGHAQCRDGQDETCDLILDEVQDAIDAVREERGNEMPNCDDPQSNGDAALCHLMEAYEVCQLDHDGDGEPDVDRMPPEACEDLKEQADNDDEAREILDEHPECEGDDNAGDDEADKDENDGTDEPKETDDHEEGDKDGDGETNDGSHLDGKSCEDVRAIAEQASEEDREFLTRERPDCFDEPDAGTDEEPADGEGEPDGETDTTDNHDEFCENLLREKAACDTDECRADIEEIYERECVN